MDVSVGVRGTCTDAVWMLIGEVGKHRLTCRGIQTASLDTGLGSWSLLAVVTSPHKIICDCYQLLSCLHAVHKGIKEEQAQPDALPFFITLCSSVVCVAIAVIGGGG